MKRPWQNKTLRPNQITWGDMLLSSLWDWAVVVFVFVIGSLFGAAVFGAELVPGAVLVSRNLEEAQNTSPGHMNHLAIAISETEVVESQAGIGVQKIALSEYLKRPYEPPSILLPRDRKAGERAAAKAASFVGLKFRRASSIFRHQRSGMNCVGVIKEAWGAEHRKARRLHIPDDIYKLKELFEPAQPLLPQTSGAGRESGWYTYTPTGCVDGKGIFREMLSRCPQWGYRQIRNADLATQTHEATHFVNHTLSSEWGQSYGAFYVGDGKFYRLAAPNVTIGQVAQCVPAVYRTGRFRTYLCGDRVNRSCLSILDELTCYTNDAQCTKELGLPTDGGLKFANEFCGFADCLVKALQEHDPDYADMDKLVAFVDSQKKRVAELSK